MSDSPEKINEEDMIDLYKAGSKAGKTDAEVRDAVFGKRLEQLEDDPDMQESLREAYKEKYGN